MIIEVGGNTLDCDVGATVAAFEAYTPGLPWTCECSGCRNYRAARTLLYTEPVLRFFAQFGIDTTKPAEIYEGGLIGDVFHCFCWFHFIGTIMESSPREEHNVFSAGVVDITEIVRVDFNDKRHLAPDSFRSKPVVQLECEFRIPWLLTEPWP